MFGFGAELRTVWGSDDLRTLARDLEGEYGDDRVDIITHPEFDEVVTAVWLYGVAGERDIEYENGLLADELQVGSGHEFTMREQQWNHHH